MNVYNQETFGFKGKIGGSKNNSTSNSKINSRKGSLNVKETSRKENLFEDKDDLMNDSSKKKTLEKFFGFKSGTHDNLSLIKKSSSHENIALNKLSTNLKGSES